ncbi:hypothetical protein BH10BAC3_BH10BAC3_05340 [soil metagenome]
MTVAVEGGFDGRSNIINLRNTNAQCSIFNTQFSMKYNHERE